MSVLRPYLEAHANKYRDVISFSCAAYSGAWWGEENKFHNGARTARKILLTCEELLEFKQLSRLLQAL